MKGKEVNLFDLKIGDSFELPDKHVYKVKRYFKKFCPILGKVLHLEAVNDEGKTQWFIRNIKVNPLNNKE